MLANAWAPNSVNLRPSLASLAANCNTAAADTLSACKLVSSTIFRAATRSSRVAVVGVAWDPVAPIGREKALFLILLLGSSANGLSKVVSRLNVVSPFW